MDSDELRKITRFEQEQIATDKQHIDLCLQWIREYERLNEQYVKKIAVFNETIKVQKEQIVKYEGFIKEAEQDANKRKARIKELKAKE
jgi:5'-deoxynucleotidase YfbR-like HD superfamily hydrolase